MFDFTRENTRRWDQDRSHCCLLDIYALREERKEGVEETEENGARDGNERRGNRDLASKTPLQWRSESNPCGYSPGSLSLALIVRQRILWLHCERIAVETEKVSPLVVSVCTETLMSDYFFYSLRTVAHLSLLPLDLLWPKNKSQDRVSV